MRRGDANLWWDSDWSISRAGQTRCESDGSAGIHDGIRSPPDSGRSEVQVLVRLAQGSLSVTEYLSSNEKSEFTDDVDCRCARAGQRIRRQRADQGFG